MLRRTDAEQIDSLERWLTTTPAWSQFDGERPFAVLAFTVVGDRAAAIDVFTDPELVAKLDIRGVTAWQVVDSSAGREPLLASGGSRHAICSDVVVTVAPNALLLVARARDPVPRGRSKALHSCLLGM